MINVTMRWNHGNWGPVSWNKRRCIWFSALRLSWSFILYPSNWIKEVDLLISLSFLFPNRLCSCCRQSDNSLSARLFDELWGLGASVSLPAVFLKGRCQNCVFPDTSFLNRAPGAFPAVRVPVVHSWAGSEEWNETRNLHGIMMHHGTLQTWRFHISWIVFVCFYCCAVKMARHRQWRKWKT